MWLTTRVSSLPINSDRLDDQINSEAHVLRCLAQDMQISKKYNKYIKITEKVKEFDVSNPE